MSEHTVEDIHASQEDDEEEFPTEDDDLEWDSDESDEDSDPDLQEASSSSTVPHQQGGNPQKQQQRQQQQPQPKRSAGHGSQRVKNKQRKSDVKRLWKDKNWGDKPTWLSWKSALDWIKRGVRPPPKQPTSTPEERASFASLLSAHKYTRNASGAIIPDQKEATTNAFREPQPQVTPQQRRDDQPHQPQELGSKATAQAQRDHQMRQANNPYGKPGTQQPPAATMDPPDATTPARPLLQHEDAPSKAEAQARQDHKDRQAMNPYRVPPNNRPALAASTTSRTDEAPHRDPPQQPATPSQEGVTITKKSDVRRLSFQLPADHRDDPPKPTRTQHVLRKLSNSTTVQITGDGLSQYPVRIVDNRPYYMQSAATQQEGVEQGDTLFAQPAHLTSATAPSSSASAILDNSDRPSGTPLDPLDISDLDLEADQAVSQGLAPGWSISGQQATARASIREGEISFDIAWTPGPEPPSIPPTVPLAPHTVLTLRGSAIGSWRGHLWTPSRGDIIRHPPRTVASPTIVAYRPLNTPPKGPALPSGACLTMRPVGTWISSTRFDLTSARTPRFWLVHIESSPPAGQGELPLTAGQSFFLEWMGDEREWVRRPRFADDIQQLGGFSTISELPPPEPPLPPQRHGFDNADPAPRRPKNTQTGVAPDRAGPYQQPPQRLTPQTTAAKVASTTTTNPTRPAKASVKAGPKAKPPPLPPQPSSGSESETSWPSEDPVAPEEDEEALSMMSTKKSGGADKNKSEPDNDDHEITSHMQRPTISPSPPSEEKETKNGETNPEEPSQTEWMTVVHNFPEGFHAQGLLHLLDKIFGELLEHSFHLNSQYSRTWPTMRLSISAS